MNHLTSPPYLRIPPLALALVLLPTLTACAGLPKLLQPDAAPVPSEVAAQPSEAATPATTVLADAAPEEPIKEVKLAPSALFEWNGNGRRVSRITIDTDKQKARFYAGNDELGWSMVATGVANYPTPTGQFNVIEKVENKRSNLYGKVLSRRGSVIRTNAKMGRDSIPAGSRFEGAHMPFFMRLTGDGVGLHAGPIPNPGSPASHGCIRLPSKLAPVLFNHVSIGTEVAINGNGPSYGNYAQKQRTEAAQTAQVTAQRQAAEKKAAAKEAAAREARARRIAAANAAKKAAAARAKAAAATTAAAAPSVAVVPSQQPVAARAEAVAPPAAPVTPAAPASAAPPPPVIPLPMPEKPTAPAPVAAPAPAPVVTPPPAPAPAPVAPPPAPAPAPPISAPAPAPASPPADAAPAGAPAA